MLIRKNNNTLKVTKGAFNALFGPQGWEAIEESEVEEKPASGTIFMAEKHSEVSPEKETSKEVSQPFSNLTAPSTSEPFEEDEEGEEEPLSEMTVKQLVEYADDHDIDLGDATRKGDIIAAIEEALESDE